MNSKNKSKLTVTVGTARGMCGGDDGTVMLAAASDETAGLMIPFQKQME